MIKCCMLYSLWSRCHNVWKTVRGRGAKGCWRYFIECCCWCATVFIWLWSVVISCDVAECWKSWGWQDEQCPELRMPALTQPASQPSYFTCVCMQPSHWHSQHSQHSEAGKQEVAGRHWSSFTSSSVMSGGHQSSATEYSANFIGLTSNTQPQINPAQLLILGLTHHCLVWIFKYSQRRSVLTQAQCLISANREVFVWIICTS